MLEWVFLFPYFLSWNRQLRRFVAKNIDDFEFFLFFTVGNFGRNREFFSLLCQCRPVGYPFPAQIYRFFSWSKIGNAQWACFQKVHHILLPSFSWESLLRSLPSSSSSLPLLDSASNSSLPLLICACTAAYAKQEKGNSQRHILFLPFSGLISHTQRIPRKKEKKYSSSSSLFPNYRFVLLRIYLFLSYFPFFSSAAGVCDSGGGSPTLASPYTLFQKKKKKNRASRLTAASWRGRRKAQSDACTEKRRFSKYEKLRKFEFFF